MASKGTQSDVERCYFCGDVLMPGQCKGIRIKEDGVWVRARACQNCLDKR